MIGMYTASSAILQLNDSSSHSPSASSSSKYSLQRRRADLDICCLQDSTRWFFLLVPYRYTFEKLVFGSNFLCSARCASAAITVSTPRSDRRRNGKYPCSSTTLIY